MKKILLNINKHNRLIYRVFLFLFTIMLLVTIYPKKPTFPYEYQKGEIWTYGPLVANFDFPILTESTHQNNFESDIVIVEPNFIEKKEVINQIKSILKNDSIPFSETEIKNYIEKLYQSYIVKKEDTENLWLYEKGVLNKLVPDDCLTVLEVQQKLISKFGVNFSTKRFNIPPNYRVNEDLTKKYNKEIHQKKKAYTKVLYKNDVLIKPGEQINNSKYEILKSYQTEFERNNADSQSSYLFLGYLLLTAMVVLMLYAYMYYFEKTIFLANNQITLVIANLIMMVVIAIVFAQLFPTYFYVLPFCIVPIVITAFMNASLGIITHILSCTLIAFFVPHSFEFMFLQIMAGIIIILTNTNLYKRISLFIAVAKIMLIYSIAYLGFELIREGNLDNFKLEFIAFFFISGLLTLLAQPVIYIFEKLFGMMSDVSLFELSDANNKLLRRLSQEAPGTMQHSFQVANLAETAALAIGANALLVRIGALYHDIGKLKNPTLFIENQQGETNPHDELEPEQSATFIIDHVIYGIKLAKKNNLPDRIIDFIRTHHGESVVYFFYKKAEEINPNVDINKFTYPGPKPFSKETAILMMSDAVEAASKSLKSPTNIDLENLVNKIIEGQLKTGQFNNADISLKEIGKIKKALYHKLNSIYHTRIEYPE